ncbi:MAG: S8 family serine peptidase [Saprospiraceae bacterium]|nr:S8 family serine peptidase [Saprospiraceae bacterium]
MKHSFTTHLSCVLIVVLGMFYSIAYAQPESFYANGPEGRQFFELDTTRILVAFAAGLPADQRAALLRREPALLPYSPALDFPQLGASVLEVQPGTTPKAVWELLSRLNDLQQLAYAAPFLRYADGTRQGILHEINVGLRHSRDLEWLLEECATKDLEPPVRNEFDSLVYVVKVRDNKMGRALEVANALFATGRPAFAEVNFLLILKGYGTNDPFQIAQWSQDNEGRYWNGSNWVYDGVEDSDMDVEPAWNITIGSASVKVAVLDDGVNLNHPDLAANILSGHDATGLGGGGAPSGDDAHGTACAGIIAAVANNNIGLAGNAFNCKIVPVRIAYTPAGQNNWYTTATWQANGINWAWQTGGASVLSNSWGGGSPSSFVQNAITSAVTNGRGGKGSPVLFAAGNDNQTPVSYPSFYSNTISVGATSMCDERKSPSSCDGITSWGSNYGTGLDVAAPGVWIVSTDIAGPAGYNSGDYTISYGGTSAACPNAASVMALILSTNPELTQTQARAILEFTCDKVGGYTYNNNVSGQPNGSWSSQLGYGRVNALSACIVATGYCPAFGNSTSDEWISSIQIGSFSKSSGDDLGYGYFTNLTAQLSQGVNYPVTLVPGYTGVQFPEYWRIWIDFNKDGDFSDAGEMVFDGGSASIGTKTGTLNMPANAATGTTRMRVAMRYNTAPDPCSQFDYGEVEDYGVVISTGGGSTNDCSQATTIACGNTVTGTTSGAPQTVSNCDTDLNTAPGRWYRYTASQTGSVTATTCHPGTNFDTKIGVFSGSCANLVCVSGNDDDGNCSPNTRSTVHFSATSGQTYYIYVTGFGSNSGNFQLSLSCGSVCATPTGLAQTGVGYAHVTLNWNAVTGATGYQTRVRTGGGAWSNGNIFTGTGVTWGNRVPNTQYEFQVRTECGSNNFSDWSPSVFVTTLGASDPYCYSYGISWNHWIAGVATSNLNNTSGVNYGYGNYTNLTVNAQKGNTYNITLTPNNNATPQTVYWRVWVDFNKDNDFNDSGEQVFQSTGSSNNPVTGTITIPAAANVGTTRMRVSMSLDNYSTPCQVNDLREVEDYTIQISDGVQAPVANFSASSTCGQFPLVVNFSDLSTNSPTAWSWNFGNGQTSTQQNPSATFNQPGIYTVALSASNAGGSDVEEKTAYITVVAPVSINTSPGNQACVGSPITLQANGANQYVWTGEGLSATTGEQVTASPNAAGSYTYTVTGSTNNCAAAPVSVSLSFNAPPAVSVTASSNSVCTGESVTLTATGASSYTWTGTGLNANTGSQVTAQPGSPGNYTYQVTGNSNGCNSNAQSVSVQFNPAPSVTVSASSNTACVGESVVLLASGANDYVWSGSGLNATTGAQVMAQPTAPGSYTYQVTGSANGCNSAPQSTTIQFSATPIVSVSASSTNTCVGNAVTLTATGAATYTWSGTGLSNNTGSNVSAQPPIPGSYTYQVIGSNNNCSAAPQSLVVQFNPTPTVSISANNNTICVGQSVTLNAFGAETYLWNGVGLLTNIGSTVTATPPAPGQYTYSVAGTANGCTAAPQTLSVQVNPTNTLSVSITAEGCPGPNLTFSANVANGGPNANILWYRNGQAVWNGPTYTLFSAANGDQIRCEATPVSLPPCTQPAMAVSNVFTVDCITTIGTTEIEGIASALLMPNPNDGQFGLQVEIERPLNGNMHIFNVLGQLLLSEKVALPAGTHTLPVRLPAPVPGHYWLVLQSERGTYRAGFEVH